MMILSIRVLMLGIILLMRKIPSEIYAIVIGFNCKDIS